MDATVLFFFKHKKCQETCKITHSKDNHCMLDFALENILTLKIE